jgi:toxin FitB
MIVLDTNVISELMRPRPNGGVLAWVDAQTENLWTTAVTLQEIVYGISRGKDVTRREILQRAFETAFPLVIGPRVLPLDTAAGRAAGLIAAQREKNGTPIGIADAQIAGIVRVNSATLVTRDVDDFSALGLTIVNPWEAG